MPDKSSTIHNIVVDRIVDSLEGVDMARVRKKLSAVAVKTAGPGWHGNGDGLWLQVSPSESKSWVLRYRFQGKDRYMGLGSATTVTLAEARRKAADARMTLSNGSDPLKAKAAATLAAEVERAKLITFAACAEMYIEAHRAGWSNPKHIQQWQNTLATYAFPLFGNIPVAEVDVSLVVRCLEPIWTTKTETASRVRGRIEAILDYATTRTFHQGENPARRRATLKLRIVLQTGRVDRFLRDAAGRGLFSPFLPGFPAVPQDFDHAPVVPGPSQNRACAIDAHGSSSVPFHVASEQVDPDARCG